MDGTANTSPHDHAARRRANTEPGYAPVLVHADLKIRLKVFREGLTTNKDLLQERRLVTAALELVLNSPELHDAWREGALKVVATDMRLSQQQHQLEASTPA
jgi:hypothetical protein